MRIEREEPDWTEAEMDQIVNAYRYAARQQESEVCPSEEALLGYIQGRLSRGQAEGIISHLPLCDLCQDLVLSFKGSAWEAPPPGGGEEAEGSPPSWKQLQRRLPEDLQAEGIPAAKAIKGDI